MRLNHRDLSRGVVILLASLCVWALAQGNVWAESKDNLSPLEQGFQESSHITGRWILCLRDPALLTVYGRRPVSGFDADVQAQAKHLQAQQEAVTADLEALGIQVEARYMWTLNGLAVRIPDSSLVTLDSLLELEGVVRAFPDRRYVPALYETPTILNVGAYWGEHGRADAGAGVKIAIVDSGVDIEHPMFDPTGFAYPPGYPLTAYTTPKVIVSRAFFRPWDPPIDGEDTPIPGAQGSEHGTYIAAIAAGNVVTATLYGEVQTLSGVAPGAQLLNYRVFYPADASGVEYAYTAELIQAVEAAVADGADVLCLAWNNASPVSPVASPLSVALQTAMDAGVVVVAPVGNDGPAFGSASVLPGGLERVIGVGMQGHGFAAALFGPELETIVGPLPFVHVADVDPSGSPYACAPLPPGALDGVWALVARGECTFADKVYHAQEAGAAATIIYNTSDELVEMACAGEHCDPGEITIPAVMITRSWADDLLSWLDASPAISPTLTLDPVGRFVSASPQWVAASSGRGPAYGRYLKPDLIAPGMSVLSAALSPGGAMNLVARTGTSGAAAHVAGAAALLLQAHPDWGHDRIKAALMATARVQDEEGMPSVADELVRGAGLVDVARAVSPTLIFEPPALSLSHLQPGGQLSVPITVTDLRGEGDGMGVDLSVTETDPLTLDMSTSLTLAPGASEVIFVTVTVPTELEDEGLEVSGLISASSGGEEIGHLPFWFQADASLPAADVLVIDNDKVFLGDGVNSAPYIADALTALGISYVVWDADGRYGATQTIPDLGQLERYRAVIWTTGENRYPDGYYVLPTPLTAADMQILERYLDRGGRLLATGQNIAEASDVNPDGDSSWSRGDLYHYYLGAHWVDDNVYGEGEVMPPSGATGVLGLPGTFLSNLEWDIGPIGNGAGNQHSVDELGVGGLRSGEDLPHVKPLCVAVGGTPQEAGYIALAKWDDPSLEDPTIDVPYRALLYSFGLEGVNDADEHASLTELLDLSLDWLWDEVSVELGTIHSAPGVWTRIRAQAISTVGAEIHSYRWEIGEGAVITTTEPVLWWQFPDVGEWPVAVEVMDALGHTAVATSRAIVYHGGASEFRVDRPWVWRGAQLRYESVLYNEGPVTATVAVTIPVPTETSWVAYEGDDAEMVGGVLRWSGELAANASQLVSLTVRVGDVPEGEQIQATAQFCFDQQCFDRQLLTPVRDRRLLPVVLGP